MSLLATAAAAFASAWESLAAGLVVDPAPHPPGEEDEVRVRDAEAQERDLRILMSHLF